ncbi:hypothetical protein GRI58_12495 [Porphyrobacter algicida]|uniref:Uncharacterized protein n=1 Tax=Qipengyuania algicida TaxID=1836209 RepID=A0A845AL99_9SPHN|nr:hypothetical protein [Qipengyuania algicida]MXP29635.1 hypothetical protein [Qipengyuania algicida]
MPLANRYWVASDLMLAVCAGCSAKHQTSDNAAQSNRDAAEEDGASPNAARGIPPIHLEQTAVRMYHGKPGIAGDYLQAEADCRHSKTLKSLSPDMVKDRAMAVTDSI